MYITRSTRRALPLLEVIFFFDDEIKFDALPKKKIGLLLLLSHIAVSFLGSIMANLGSQHVYLCGETGESGERKRERTL